jgi:hypothetical protein
MKKNTDQNESLQQKEFMNIAKKIEDIKSNIEKPI